MSTQLFQLDHCTDNWQGSCLRTVRPNLHSDIVKNLRRLSFTSMTAGSDAGVTPDPVPVTSNRHHHFTQNGRLVTQIQFLFPIDEQQNETEPVKNSLKSLKKA